MKALVCAIVCLCGGLAGAMTADADPNFRQPDEGSTTDTGPLAVTVGGTIVAPTWDSGHAGFAMGLEAVRVVHLGREGENTPSMHRAKGLYAFNGRWRFESTSHFFWGDNRWSATLAPRYDGLRTVFQGVGNPAPLPDQEEYEPSELRLAGALFRRVVPHVRVGLAFDVHDHQIHEADATSHLRTDPALDAQQGRLVGLGPVAYLDTRDAVFNPSRGLFGVVSHLHFADPLGSQFAGDEYRMDVRVYRPLAQRHTLAWQGYTLRANGSVPFWRLPSLGELSHSRAYDALRLRAHLLVATQLEWRWRFSRRLGCEVYVGTAVMGPDLEQLRISRARESIGASLRIFRSIDGQLVPMRVGAAWGDDGWRMQVGVGDAF